jgi:hypothetical protein
MTPLVETLERRISTAAALAADFAAVRGACDRLIDLLIEGWIDQPTFDAGYRPLRVKADGLEQAVTRTAIRCAVYARVSTPKQTVSSQQAELRAYVAAHGGWSVAGEYADVGTGASAFRPGLRDLLALVDAGAVDIVLVTSYDRLSRDYAQHLALLERLRTAGVLVCSLFDGLEAIVVAGELRVLGVTQAA